MSDTQGDEIHFDRYLSGGSRLSRRYRALSSDTPPPHLDARILRKAKRETRRLPARTWISVSLAATVLLASALLVWLRLAVPPSIETSLSLPIPPAPVEPLETTAARKQEAASADRGSATALMKVEPKVSAAIIELETPATGVLTFDAELLAEPEITVEFLEHPGLWVDYIEALVEEDRWDEALTHLKALRRRHNEYPLPEPLRSLDVEGSSVSPSR